MTTVNSKPKSRISPSGLDLRLLKSSLAEIFTANDSVGELKQKLSECIISLTGAGVVSIGACKRDNSEADTVCIGDKGQTWGEDLVVTLQQGGKRAIERNQLAVARLAGREGVFLIAVPFAKSETVVESICVAVETTEQSSDVLIVIFQLLAQSLSLWFQKNQTISSLAAPSADPGFAELHSSIAAALATGDRKQAGPVFVQMMKEYFQADVVMLAPGLQNVGGQSILHSSISGFSETAPQMKLIKQVVAECKQQKQLLTWKLEPQLPVTLQSLLLRDMTVALFAAQAVCFPLRDQSQTVVGVLVVCWNEPRQNLATPVKRFIYSEQLAAGIVAWIGQSLYPKQLSQSFFNARKRSILLAAVFLGIVLLGLLPVDFTVSGKCVLEPRQTRFVVAQFDAVLKKVHKVPGATVTKGELLAEFDERVIELEINSLLAEIQKTRKMQDVHTATGKAALSQMAALERRGLEEKLQLYRNRLSKLTIKSPVDGVVISENMERIEGSPINRGQGLFEIAPLKDMIVEAHIAQEDIGFVQKEADTTIRLEPFPDRNWKSSVYTIFPRADIRGGQNVFLIESLLANEENILRPGMRGEIKVVAGRKPLAWKLFRKPWMYFQKTFLND